MTEDAFPPVVLPDFCSYRSRMATRHALQRIMATRSWPRCAAAEPDIERCPYTQAMRTAARSRPSRSGMTSMLSGYNPALLPSA